jgi:hypothetical protein
VPLGRRLAKACPLFLESDVIALSSAVRYTGQSIQDQLIDATHALRGQGPLFVKLLAQGTTYGTLLTAGQGRQTTSTDLREFLGFLNLIGALQTQRALPRTQRLRITMQHALIGITYSPLSVRQSADITAIVFATLRATTPVLLATGVVAALFVGAGLASISSTLIAVAASLLLFLISIVLHEYVHVYTLRTAGLAVDILQRGMHLGLIHAQPPWRTDVISALAGPLAGGLICWLSALAYEGLGQTILAITALIVSSFHFISLLPTYGDGQSIKRAWQERRRRYS